MRTPRLFIDRSLAADTAIELCDAPAHYLRTVLRLRPGDPVTLFNGTGGEYRGEISAMDRRRVGVTVGSFIDADRESPLTIMLGLGVIRRDAMDAAIQKATELGVSEITPLITEFTSTAKSATRRHDHWVRVIRSACEQCERNIPPTLHQTMPASDWIASTTADLKLAAHPRRDSHIRTIDARPQTVAVLIGPEGGLSEAELQTVRSHQFEIVSLGPRILRAETAPTALIALIQSRWGDL